MIIGAGPLKNWSPTRASKPLSADSPAPAASRVRSTTSRAPKTTGTAPWPMHAPLTKSYSKVVDEVSDTETIRARRTNYIPVRTEGRATPPGHR